MTEEGRPASEKWRRGQQRVSTQAPSKRSNATTRDRTSKFAFVQLVKKTGRTSASAFLEALIAAVPYKIHTVLTDNGIQFTFPPRHAEGPTARYVTHVFDMRCRENGIEHRLTKIKHRGRTARSNA